jgi:hypothetical protein
MSYKEKKKFFIWTKSKKFGSALAYSVIHDAMPVQNLTVKLFIILRLDFKYIFLLLILVFMRYILICYETLTWYNKECLLDY